MHSTRLVGLIVVLDFSEYLIVANIRHDDRSFTTILFSNAVILVPSFYDTHHN